MSTSPVSAPASTGIIIVGDEILSGAVQDRNAAWLSRELSCMGLRNRLILVLPDELPVLVEQIRICAATHDYLFICGGIGPTPDDVTRPAVAAAFKRPCTMHPQARQALQEHYGTSITAARLKMAELPQGCDLIANPISGAPGFMVENVFVFPGFPHMLQAMFPSIRERLPQTRCWQSTLITTVYEGDYTPLMEKVQAQFPNVRIGSYPSATGPPYQNRLVFKGYDQQEVRQAHARLEQALQQLQ